MTCLLIFVALRPQKITRYLLLCIEELLDRGPTAGKFADIIFAVP
jgi:hypothetical protein